MSQKPALEVTLEHELNSLDEVFAQVSACFRKRRPVCSQPVDGPIPVTTTDQSGTTPVVQERSAHLMGMTTDITTGRGLEPLMNIEELAVSDVRDWLAHHRETSPGHGPGDR